MSTSSPLGELCFEPAAGEAAAALVSAPLISSASADEALHDQWAADSAFGADAALQDAAPRSGQTSPAAAVREYLARRPGEPMMTLVDPSAIWAPSLVRALADTTGQPPKRVRVCHVDAQRTVATLDRCVVKRREELLELCHVDIPVTETWRGLDGGGGEALCTSVEVSAMAALFVGSMTRTEFESVLNRLAAASRSMTWLCPTVFVLVPPGIDWCIESIRNADWPDEVHVEWTDAPLRDTSAVWNALLEAWDRNAERRVPVLAARDDEAAPVRLMASQLRLLMGTEGFVGCAVADAQTGAIVAGESHDGSVDLARTAMVLAQALRVHQHAAQAIGSSPVEEFVVCAGPDQHIVRPLRSRPNLFIFARLHSAYGNQTLARLKLSQVQSVLG